MTIDPTQQALTEARINIGRLQVQFEHLTNSMEDLQESNRQQTLKIDQILIELSAAKGGWRTLMLVGGAASTVGAGITWIVAHAPRWFS